jgi:hypothetical protein
MSKMELTGTIKLIGETQSFDSGFAKREFVITTEDKYPQDVKFEVVKEKCTELNRFKPGQKVTVAFNIRGNEYNGKYYVNLQAWMIADYKQETASTKTETVEEDLPF